MKKVTLLLGFAIIGFITLPSCSREHTCECVTTQADGSESTNKTVVNGSRKKAQESCDKKDVNSPIIPKVSCELK